MQKLALLLTLTATALTVFAQPGSGARFGARDPKVCASTKEPKRGAPSPDQLKQYVICQSEKFTGTPGTGQLLYLMSDVTVEVAKPRPFQMRTDAWSDIDPSEPVYPIRGSYVSWQCAVIGSINGDRGKNCSRTDGPNAKGICFKTTFGDWQCKFLDGNSSSPMQRFPPPTGN
jgi:hypothetical protein